MRQHLIVWLGGVLASPVLISCAPSSVESVSGLQGVALRSPVCPGPARLPLQPSCVGAPVAVALKVVANDGTVISRFITAKDGTFRVVLAPGTYTLLADQALVFGRLTPLPVTVTDKSFTTVELHLDSGIR